MFQMSEVVNLAADLISLPILILVLRNKALPRYRLFLAALGAIILAHTFTIVEAFALEPLFNACEHISFLAAAILFFVGAIRYFLPRVNRWRS